MLGPTYFKTTHLLINFVLVTNGLFILYEQAAKKNDLVYFSVNNLFLKSAPTFTVDHAVYIYLI